MQTFHDPPTKTDLIKGSLKSLLRAAFCNFARNAHPTWHHFPSPILYPFFKAQVKSRSSWSLAHSDYSLLCAFSNFPLSQLSGINPVLLYNVPYTVTALPHMYVSNLRSPDCEMMEVADHVSYFMYLVSSAQNLSLD